MTVTFTKLVLAATICFWSAPLARAQYCRVFFHMSNTARHVIGEVNTECGGISPHSATWGNWGVSSNFGNKTNGDQFRGWHPEDGQGQWNSCTSAHIRDTDVIYYNHDHNGNGLGDDQWSDGEYSYAGGVFDFYFGCPYDVNRDGRCDINGCLPLKSQGVTVTDQFLTLYEIDPGSPDDFITSLYVDTACCRANMSRTLRSCSGPVYSPWYPTTYSTDTNITTNVRLVVRYASFISVNNYCENLARYNPGFNWSY